MLETDEGVDRAFAKLDTIKDSVVWWEAGAQPPQLLADGEVVMTTAYNGRIFNAAVGEGQPFEILWDGQILDFDLFVIPKGAPNLENAMKYITFATDTQRSGRSGQLDQLRSGAQILGRAGRSLFRRQDRDGAAYADSRSQS